MPYTELTGSPLGELQRDEEKGWITEAGKRILTFRVGTFQALMGKLETMAGPKVSKTILHQLGAEIGKVSLQYSQEQVTESNLEKVLDRITQTRGWGRCVGVEKRKSDATHVYVFTMNECPLCYHMKMKEASCHLMGGIVTGWMEALLKRKAQSTMETNCAGTGGKSCVFEITFAAI